jgi:hypothetical protein
MDAAGRTSLFREVNVCIDELLERFGAADEAEFLCECPAAACSRLLTLTRFEFERIRAEGAFIVAAGCVFAALSFGTAVRYVVVPELRGAAGAPERAAQTGAVARLGAAARPARRSAVQVRRQAAVPRDPVGWGAPAA